MVISHINIPTEEDIFTSAEQSLLSRNLKTRQTMSLLLLRKQLQCEVGYKFLVSIALTFWFVLFPVVFLACLTAIEHSPTTRAPLQMSVFEWQKAHSGSLRVAAHRGGSRKDSWSSPASDGFLWCRNKSVKNSTKLSGEMSSSNWLLSGEKNGLNGKFFIFVSNLVAAPVTKETRKMWTV